MRSNYYEFVSHWEAEGSREDVYSILIAGVEYPRWWPEVYLQVEELDAGGIHGIGKRARLLTKGWLPYKLRWEMEIVETDYPGGFRLEAKGDFVGSGAWRFLQISPKKVSLDFDWRLTAEKPLLRHLSFAFKPLFRANHRWAMARGEEGLGRELRRRSDTIRTIERSG